MSLMLFREPTLFLDQKKMCTQKLLGSKTFLHLNFFWAIVFVPKIFWHPKILAQIFVHSESFVTLKLFLPQFFLTQFRAQFTFSTESDNNCQCKYTMTILFRGGFIIKKTEKVQTMSGFGHQQDNSIFLEFQSYL